MANQPRHPDRPLSRPAPEAYRPPPTARADSYRPRWATRDNGYRPGERQSDDKYRPGRDSRHERREEMPRLPPIRSAVTKTKHERNTNPSTRIHSLKRQLQSEELPGTIRQERERELAVLLVDREKTKHKKIVRRNLQRYHFIRFLERTKSERQMKKLVKNRDSCKDEIARNELEKQIHMTEVDLNYSKYAPLGDKYFALFPNENEGQNKKPSKVQNIVKNASGVKPPLWFEVENLMIQGVTQLEALRDGKLTTKNQVAKNLALLGGKEDAKRRMVNGKDLDDTAPEWLDDDGVIDPQDLDSDQDDDMSDGGFFER